jgi:O-antigen ligase
VSVRAGLLTRVGTGLVLLVLFLGSAGAGLGVGSDSAVRPLLERMGTLFNDPATIGSNEKSLQGRASETRLALSSIGDNLVTGVGAGVSYGYYFNELQPSGRWIPKPQKFLHNQWLWLTLVGGVPLLLAWATFLGATLRRAWAPGREALTTAAGVGLTMIMVSALVELYFSTEGMTTTIGLLAGVIHAGRNAADETGEPLL